MEICDYNQLHSLIGTLFYTIALAGLVVSVRLLVERKRVKQALAAFAAATCIFATWIGYLLIAIAWGNEGWPGELSFWIGAIICD
mgnify:CR=1 FL=1|jgi:hypothetical protein